MDQPLDNLEAHRLRSNRLAHPELKSHHAGCSSVPGCNFEIEQAHLAREFLKLQESFDEFDKLVENTHERLRKQGIYLPYPSSGDSIKEFLGNFTANSRSLSNFSQRNPVDI